MAYSLLILFCLLPDPIRARGFTDRDASSLSSLDFAPTSQLFATHTSSLIRRKRWPTIFNSGLYSAWLSSSSSLMAYLSLPPTIVAGFGYTPMNSLLLTMSAGFVGGCFKLGAVYLDSRLLKRGLRTWVLAGFLVPTIVGAVLVWKLLQSSTGGLLVGDYT
jgi:hypothetical protein